MATGSVRPRAFAAAFADLNVGRDDYAYWRGDYGSQLRDKAAVLTLAAEIERRRRRSRALADDASPREREAARYT